MAGNIDSWLDPRQPTHMVSKAAGDQTQTQIQIQTQIHASYIGTAKNAVK